MEESLMRERLCKDLLGPYDSNTGFDLDHLDEFLAACHVQEMAALKEDPELHIYDSVIPGPEGNPEMKVRIYEPAGRTGLLPGILFFHGGGYLFGSIYRQDNMCQCYAKNVNAVVVSVEYRLAPKWKAPAPVEDGYAALRWADEHGSSVGIDNSKIAIMGISAGGGLTAALALMTRDRKGPQPILQLPLYAVLDHRMETFSSRNITSPKVWSYGYSVKMWDSYLDKNKEPDYYASPSLCEDLSGICPIFSYVGGLDPFCDENMIYWQRAADAGVAVEGHLFPGCYHCFEISGPEARYSRNAYDLAYAALKSAFDQN